MAQLARIDCLTRLRQHGLQQVLQCDAGLLDAAEVGKEFIELEPRRVLDQDLDVAENGRRGGGELLAQVREQRTLEARVVGGTRLQHVGRLGRALAEQRFDLAEQARQLDRLGVEVVAARGDRLFAIAPPWRARSAR